MSLPARAWKGHKAKFHKHPTGGKWESVPQPQRLLFAEATFTRLNHTDLGVIHPNSSGLATWRTNSLFDPLTAIGGHQPFLFDQWSLFYTHYLVVKSTFTVTIGPNNGVPPPQAETGPLLVFTALEHATDDAGNFEQLLSQSVTYLLESNRVQSDCLSSGFDQVDLTTRVLHWDLLQEPLADGDNYVDNILNGWAGHCGGPLGTNPNYQPQFGFLVSPQTGYSKGYHYRVDIVYDVIFFGPVIQATS